MPEDDQVGLPLPPEQPQAHRPVFVAVDERDAETPASNVRTAGSRSRTAGSSALPWTARNRALPGEPVEDALGDEVAGVDHQVGGPDRLARSTDQPGVVPGVRIRERHDHERP